MQLSPRLQAWLRAGKTYRHAGFETFFRDEGSGPTLLLLHGFPTASWDWAPLWAELTRRFRVIAPDFLGYGFSAKPTNHAYHVFDHADQVQGLLASLGIDGYGILAHDYGDTVVQELIARSLEGRARAPAFVCLLNGGLFPEVHRPRLIQKLLLWPTGPLVVKLLTEQKFRRSFSEIFGPRTQPSDEVLSDSWQLVAYENGTRNYHRLIRYITQRKQNRERWVGALQKCPSPLRFVVGEVDPISGRHMAERFGELISNPDVVLLEEIGHYPQMEDPAGVLAAFLEVARA